MSLSPVYAWPRLGRHRLVASEGRPARDAGRGMPSGRGGGELLGELFRQRAPIERFLATDLALLHQIEQRLIHRLHSELLPGLHRGVDLVDLLLADYVSDGRGGYHDLERHDAPPAVPGGDQLLGEHALERGEDPRDL